MYVLQYQMTNFYIAQCRDDFSDDMLFSVFSFGLR